MILKNIKIKNKKTNLRRKLKLAISVKLKVPERKYMKTEDGGGDGDDLKQKVVWKKRLEKEFTRGV